MFQVGDLMIYSSQGMCRVEDICEKTMNGNTRMYYVLQPMESNFKMTIMTPVDNDKVSMLELLKIAEAEKIMEIFSGPAGEWPDHPTQRHKKFLEAINSGDRMNIAHLVLSYLERETNPDANQNRMQDNDKKLLDNAKRILFKELAACYSCSVDTIRERISERMAS